MKRKYPYFLLFSGIAQGLVFNAVVGIAGLIFLVMGFVAFVPLKIVGALILAFYLLISVVQPANSISKAIQKIKQEELDRILEKTFRSNKRVRLSSYKKAMLAIEDAITGHDLED